MGMKLFRLFDIAPVATVDGRFVGVMNVVGNPCWSATTTFGSANIASRARRQTTSSICTNVNAARRWAPPSEFKKFILIFDFQLLFVCPVGRVPSPGSGALFYGGRLLNRPHGR